MRVSNYTKLVNLLKKARRRRVVEFDYRRAVPSRPGHDCGCVLHYAAKISEDSIVVFLGVSLAEADYIAGWAPLELLEIDPKAVHFNNMSPKQARGKLGINEALRRLSVVFTRHKEAGKARRVSLRRT